MHFTNLKLFVVFTSVLVFCKAEPVKKVRVATKDEIQKAISGEGVSVEYWYNITTNPKDTNLGSVPGCPQSVDGVPWIFYGNPKRCHLATFLGPCTSPSVLLMQAESPYGICGCRCLATLQPEKLLASKEIYISCLDREDDNQTLIFDRINQKCYTKGENGPCQNGNLVSGHSNTTLLCLPVCEKNDQGQRNYAKGLCERNYNGGPALVALPTGIQAKKNCPTGKRYSEKLQKCTLALNAPVG